MMRLPIGDIDYGWPISSLSLRFFVRLIRSERVPANPPLDPWRISSQRIKSFVGYGSRFRLTWAAIVSMVLPRNCCEFTWEVAAGTVGRLMKQCKLYPCNAAFKGTTIPLWCVRRWECWYEAAYVWRPGRFSGKNCVKSNPVPTVNT